MYMKICVLNKKIYLLRFKLLQPAEILLKLALNTNQSINEYYNSIIKENGK